MRFKILLGVLLMAASLSPKNAKAQSLGRERLNFDADWRFYRGEIKGSTVDNGLILYGWRYIVVGKDKPTDEGPAAANFKPSSSWKTAKNGEDVFNRTPGFAWFCNDLPDIPGPQRVLHFTAVDDNATVWVNGTKLIHHEGWNDPFQVPLDKVWKEGGPNRVTVLVHNLHAPGYIKEATLLTVGRKESVPPVAEADFDDKAWRTVRLPHDFVVEGTFAQKEDTSHGFLPKDIGWYRKTFEVPASDKGKSLWIDFDGVYRDSRVWLNGTLLGRHRSGYTSFRYDITDTVNYGGENQLTVHVDCRTSEGWWYEGGGIYRHVWLNKADPLHVEPWGVYVVSTPKGKQADVTVQTTLVNASDNPASGTLVSEVRDMKGRTVLKLSSPASLPKNGKKTLTQKGRIASAALWDLDSPNLYRLVTRVERGGKILDGLETKFGVRSVRFDKDKGLFLNGKPVKIKGTCNHQDHAGVGVAIPDRLFTYRLERLKEMGSNSYRCSHNPPAAELLDECDRLGILVEDENRKLGDSPEVLDQLESMVLRDRNHPSVILWSICNEESLQGTKEGRSRGEAMKKKILGLDKTRLVTAAMNYGWGGEGLSNLLDLQGINYAIDQYDAYRASHPQQPMIGSETASTVSTRGEYATSREKGYVSAYDVNHTSWSTTAEVAWRTIAERPWMAGAYVWTGFDYRGEPTPYGWPCVNSHFGILDVCGFPKDNFYYYQAQWSGKPVLHLFPHWNWSEKMDRQVDVWVHTNYDQVQLFLNDENLGIKETPKHGHLEWKVWYKPGTLTAKALKNGKVVAETKVETVGEPSQIKLEPYQEAMTAGVGDAMPVNVSILDKEGRLVPDAANEVSFKVAGPGFVSGVGNGDPSCHEPDKAEKRSAFHGLCQVIVQAGDEPGTIELTASSKGLKAATITLKSGKP